jgi:hypothetical protein
MATTQDASIGVGTETTYKTGVTVNRWFEYLDESLDWAKNIKQGKGLRVGGRVARSGRRVIPTAEGGGDFSLECTSKGMGLLWSYLLGSGTSTLVGGTTYQQVFTLADTLPSFTLQKGMPELGGTVDAYTYLGCTADSFEIDLVNADIATVKATIDAADLTTATAYAPPSYPAAPNLFQFANATLYAGTLTPPTATALASGTTPIANVRGGTVALSHNTKQDRYNFGGGGRKAKPTVGLRTISGKLDAEYDSITFRDAVLNDTPMPLIFTYTAGALSTGVETMQIILPEVKFDSEMPKTNGTDLVMQSMAYQALDNLTATQPIWVVIRTSDTAL